MFIYWYCVFYVTLRYRDCVTILPLGLSSISLLNKFATNQCCLSGSRDDCSRIVYLAEKKAMLKFSGQESNLYCLLSVSGFISFWFIKRHSVTIGRESIVTT